MQESSKKVFVGDKNKTYRQNGYKPASVCPRSFPDKRTDRFFVMTDRVDLEENVIPRIKRGNDLIKTFQTRADHKNSS